VAAARAVAPTLFETQTLNLINTYRANRGLRRLSVHEKLYLLSKQHSRHMYTTRRMSHDGFYDRYLLSGFSTCVEDARVLDSVCNCRCRAGNSPKFRPRIGSTARARASS
jgi:hypothetical protein